MKNHKTPKDNIVENQDDPGYGNDFLDTNQKPDGWKKWYFGLPEN